MMVPAVDCEPRFASPPPDPLDFSRDEIARQAAAIAEYGDALVSLSNARDDVAMAALFRRLVGRAKIIGWSLELIFAGTEGQPS